MLRLVQQMVIIIVLILTLAALPEIITVNNVEKSLDWQWGKLPDLYVHFITELANGSLGTYQVGSEIREISDDIVDNIITSFIIMAAGIWMGVILSLIFGVFLSRFFFTRFFRLLINIFAIVPDFLIIIFSLIVVVKVYKLTGMRIISFRPDAGALNMWFPVILVSISPTLYLFKLISIKYSAIASEDYIRTAVAKGLGIEYINFQHVFKNVEPFILAELTKIISLAAGNLFIIEYLLNVSGITKFIFQSNGVQPIAIGLFSMLAISLVVYVSIRMLFYLFKRGFIYE